MKNNIKKFKKKKGKFDECEKLFQEIHMNKMTNIYKKLKEEENGGENTKEKNTEIDELLTKQKKSKEVEDNS